MIAHDATLVLSAIVEAGGEIDEDVLDRQVSTRLSCTFVASLRFLLDAGFIDRFIFSKQREVKLSNPEKYSLENKAASSKAKSSKAAISQLMERTTDRRNFSAAYQLVVNGHVARADPVMKFAEEMSPVDRGNFWTSWSNMHEEEQANYRARLSRLAYRSRRN